MAHLIDNVERQCHQGEVVNNHEASELEGLPISHDARSKGEDEVHVG